jgi:hypothetical protein
MISPGALGAMSVVVLFSWLFANFWLVIPPLRPHLGLCYAIAVVMAYLPLFVLYGGTRRVQAWNGGPERIMPAARARTPTTSTISAHATCMSLMR